MLNGTVSIDEVYKEIFENKYLKYKSKYVLYDLVIEKVKYSVPVTMISPVENKTYYIYDIIYDK